MSRAALGCPSAGACYSRAAPRRTRRGKGRRRDSMTQQQPKSDNAGFMIGMVLFSVLIPALFGIAVYLSPTG